MSTLLSAKSHGRFLPFYRKNPSKSTIFSRKPFQINPARDLTGGRRDYSRLSSCLPLTREVANPEGLTEGEIRRAYAKRDTQSGRVANSLPQSPAATAPSSEGAKGTGELREPAIERGGAERMRSGGVVGRVQEKVTCDRKPVPTRCPQPLSQTLRVCQLPLHRGAKPHGGRGILLCRSQALRGTRRLRILLKKSVSPQFCPGRVSGALLFLENGKGIAAQHHLRSNPF